MTEWDGPGANGWPQNPEPLECLEDGDTRHPCHGAVEYRMALSATGISYPRCAYHWEKRLDEQERLNERIPDSPLAPAWFDPADAGERWDEDD